MVLLRRARLNGVCCALIHAEAAAVAFAPMRVSSAHFASATLPCQTWRKSSFERRSASEPHLSRTPSMNARRATCATSASDAAPSAITFAESWVSAVRARIVSSQSCSAISWTWRCSTVSLQPIVVTAGPVAASFPCISPRRWFTLANPQRRANGRGHAALLPQSLDNRGAVTHMTTPGATTTGDARCFLDIPLTQRATSSWYS